MSKVAIFLSFLAFFSLNVANAITLSKEGEASLDASDESWFAHAGIRRAGFAGDSNYLYYLDHDMTDGIHLVLSDHSGDIVFEKDFPESYPKDIQIFPANDFIFIFHEVPGNYEDKILSVYKLSDKSLVKEVSKIDLKSYFFDAPEARLYYSSFEKLFTEDLSAGNQASQVYDSNSLRAFMTSKGLFFVERTVSVSKGKIFDKHMNEIYEIDDPHSIYLNPMKFNMTVKDDRYLVLYNRNESKLVSMYDLTGDTELLNNSAEEISISKTTSDAAAIAFFHHNSQMVSFLDFDNDSVTKKDIGYQYLFKTAIESNSKNLRFWTFPQKKIVDYNIENSSSSDVSFSCLNYTFSASASKVGCLESDKFTWWAIN
jgi:hypothetical protein